MGRENDVDERPSERRSRTKGEKDPNRPHRTRKPRPIDPETGEPIRSSHRRRRDKDRDKDRDKEKDRDAADEKDTPLQSGDGDLGLARAASAPFSSSRSSLPYPSFSKAHSREAVNIREDHRNSSPQVNLYTPDPTDLSSGPKARAKSVDNVTSTIPNMPKDSRPPSPPETATDFSRQRKGPPSGMAQVQEETEPESRPSSRTSWFRRSPLKERESKSKLPARSVRLNTSTPVKASSNGKHPDDDIVDDETSEVTNSERNNPDDESSSAVDSNATSIAPKIAAAASQGKKPLKLETDSSPESAQDSSPRTPTQTPQFPPPPPPNVDLKPAPSPFITFDLPGPQSSAYDSPQPPPPPPPPMVPVNIPRVDYLMQNGGLNRPVPKSLLAAASTYNLPQHFPLRTPAPATAEIEKIFAPYFTVLGQYEKVLSKNGSVAVATGYRSVARRLLDRLEAVFARDLSAEECSCIICEEDDDESVCQRQRLGWGDVLEWVSGRRELPVWPAFDFGALGIKRSEDLAGLGISDSISGELRPPSPVKIDPDVAEEFREHYLRQSKKAKQAVDLWLSTCPQTAAAPPQEVDDETLSFAILTHLDQDDQYIFNSIMAGTSGPAEPASRAPTPLGKPRADLIVKTTQALQRLYRLPSPPRDPEAGIYLLKNPEMHSLLATLSGINNSEWEILISGRFDGFLWSGAESEFPSMSNTPMASRGATPANGIPPRGPMSPVGRPNSSMATPFSPNMLRSQTFSPQFNASRGPTPASYASMSSTPFQQNRQPVSNDEEAEIAVLAEVEREIYLSMESLEDAFEALHRKAEVVRRGLRERGAGLSLASQSRYATQPNILSTGTPGLGPGYERMRNWAPESESGEGPSESEWGGDEAQSELAPDDSASNISSSRHRRPKRRNERRTPAPVEEEDEN